MKPVAKKRLVVISQNEKYRKIKIDAPDAFVSKEFGGYGSLRFNVDYLGFPILNEIVLTVSKCYDFAEVLEYVKSYG